MSSIQPASPAEIPAAPASGQPRSGDSCRSTLRFSPRLRRCAAPAPYRISGNYPAHPAPPRDASGRCIRCGSRAILHRRAPAPCRRRGSCSDDPPRRRDTSGRCTRSRRRPLASLRPPGHDPGSTSGRRRTCARIPRSRSSSAGLRNRRYAGYRALQSCRRPGRSAVRSLVWWLCLALSGWFGREDEQSINLVVSTGSIPNQCKVSISPVYLAQVIEMGASTRTPRFNQPDGS